MRQSLTFIPTMREMPYDVEVKSHKMLLRAGFIHQSENGVYSYLPLAKRVLTKIEKIIRKEMEAVNAVELLLPTMQPSKVWEQSGRLGVYESEIFRFKNRQDEDYILAPTNEEFVISLVQNHIHSSEQLPLILFQIQTKFRDEIELRNGLLRSREFIMKDAYSFHENDNDLDVTYEKMYQAYSNILTRLGLNFKAVIAGFDIIGDNRSNEFIIFSPSGEDIIAYSTESNYAANVKIARVIEEYDFTEDTIYELEKIPTPNVSTIEEVSQFFHTSPLNCIKTLVYNVDEELYVALVRGDHEINERKLKSSLNASIIRLADEKEIENLLGCTLSFIGPIMLPVNVKVIADHAIKSIRNGVAGANKEGFYFMNVNPERDFAINQYEDIRYVQEGDLSPDGQGVIQFANGIEVGHIIKIGTTLSEKLNVTIENEFAETKPISMGYYGIEISRLLAIVAEQNQDENGFVWPKQLSPYDIHLMPINSGDEIQSNLAEELYSILTSYHFDVLYDDRLEHVDNKFMDADLIGLPVRVTIGEKASEGKVEVRVRQSGEVFEWAKEELIDRLNEFFRIN